MKETPVRRHLNVWIVVPAYNECEAIAETVNGLFAIWPNIVVVDDGSTDDTARIAKRCGAQVVRHIANLGQGAALQTGIDAALRFGASHVCTFDADGLHDPAVVQRLLDSHGETGADVVLASRFLSASPNVPWLRRYMLRAAIQFTRWQTGLPLTDTHNGLRLFTRRAAEAIRIRQNGMAHASEILCAVSDLNLSYCEVASDVAYTSYSLRKGQTVFDSARILFDIVYAAWSR